MATIVGDVTDRSGATTHKIYLVLLRRSKVSTKGKNTATYQNLRGRVPSTPFPLYHGGGMNLRVRPSVNFLAKLNHTPTRLITPYHELSSFHHALDLNNFRAEGQS